MFSHNLITMSRGFPYSVLGHQLNRAKTRGSAKNTSAGRPPPRAIAGPFRYQKEAVSARAPRLARGLAANNGSLPAAPLPGRKPPRGRRGTRAWIRPPAGASAEARGFLPDTVAG